jgi:ribokinase
MDLVVRAPRRPRAGESLLGTDFGMFTGGKGMNQAIAAARSGAGVRVIGRLGDDIFAPPFERAFADNGMNATWVTRDAGAGTGVAMPLIEPDGQNSIVVVPRANMSVTPEDITAAESAFAGADVLLLQFENAQPAVWAAAQRGREHGLRVIVTPAPAQPIAPEHLRLADILVPNETEAETLTGIPAETRDGAERAARALLADGCQQVIVTLGSRGALWLAGPDAEAVHLQPIPVRQVDATAAGDAFCGALAAALAGGRDMPEALRWAGAAGALAVTQLGAGPSMPTAEAIAKLLALQSDLS